MECVVHRVSMQTLVDRGLDMDEYRENIWDQKSNYSASILPSTLILRKKIANTVCDVTFDTKVHVSYSKNMFKNHERLADMALAFEARALELNIPWKIFEDCCVHSSSCPTDFERCYNVVQEDCNEVFLDWWLYEYESHIEYVAHLQDIMTSQWIELSGNMNGTSEDSAWFKEEFEILMERKKEMEAEVEADAVRIGL